MTTQEEIQHLTEKIAVTNWKNRVEELEKILERIKELKIKQGK